ncbi:hypothetical protein PISL3812_01135 [Talaromyces islandicus]|uniref:Ubiquitin-like protease family profile domain-containing protein n=1 Tax=Talaromyces islandicus TaxID=28573 RepID=A0A0U1LL72_TALIS|nr:hypothetical protein PISL3812_01135 [Talaromyces islandicus]
MDTVMADAPAGEYAASPDPMDGIEYYPSAAPLGYSYQSPQHVLRRNLLSNSNLPSRPTLQLSTFRDRQARRQQVTRRWRLSPNDPFYHDMEEARAENRAEQRAFDRSHLHKRNGARFPFSSPKRTRAAYEQDTSDQRRVVDATPQRVVDVAARPLLDVTPQPLVDASSRHIGDRDPQNLLDGSPRLIVDAASQPLMDTTPEHPVHVAPQPARVPLWPAALYRRATWRAAVPPWRRILVPVSQIARLARRTAEHGIKRTIRTGITVASAFSHLYDRRAETPETQMAAPAPVAQPNPEPETEPLAEPEAEPWDPVSVQLQAELLGYASQIPSPPPSPPAPIEVFAPHRRLETSANAISEEDSIRMMVANATREARERERAETVEEAAPQAFGEDESHEREAEQTDFQPEAEPQFALVPPLAPWVRSPIRFNPAVPQVASWSSISPAPSSPEIAPSPRPVEETPALNLAPPAHPVDEVPALRPIDETPALRLIPSTSRPADTVPALDLAPTNEAPALGSSSLHAIDATPALGLAPRLRPSDQTPALGLSPLRPVDAPPALLPIVPSSRPIDVTPALRLMPSSSGPLEITPAPLPIVPNPTTLVDDASSPGPIAPSLSRSVPTAPEAHADSSPSRQLPMTPVTRVIPQLMRRYRGTPAPRRTPRAHRPPLDADIEETRNLLSAATVSGEDGIVPTRIQWWEADTPLGRPISAVRLFSSNEPPANVSANRTGALQSDEFEEMQREARLRVIRERTMALSRQRVPEGEAAVRPLSERMEQLVNSAMSATSNRVLGSTLEGAELTKQKLLTCYQDLAWLNDEIINGHLALTVDYLRGKANNTGRNVRPKYYAFNSFFYSKLRDGGYKEVSRWARRAKIDGAHLLEVETVFVPVHQQSHWTLLVVSPANKTIEYFDSLGSRLVSFVDTIKEWLKGELGDRYDEEEWTVLRTPSPKQNNGSDCGVFLLTTAKAVALGLEPTAYGPADIPLLRRKIVAELLNSGFRGDLDPSGPGPARL